MSQLIGNYHFIVYRLCKYTSENIQTFEIEDDDPIVLSDDEDNVVSSDSDGEPFDIKEEYDLDIQLSRNFNIEIKRELLELDDYEAVKKEPVEMQFTDTNENVDGFMKDLKKNPCAGNESPQGPLLEDDRFENDSDDSNDSDRTVCFFTSNERNENHADDLPHSSDAKRTNLENNNSEAKDLESKLMETSLKSPVPQNR